MKAGNLGKFYVVVLRLNSVCMVEIYSDIQWFHKVLFNEEGLSSVLMHPAVAMKPLKCM